MQNINTNFIQRHCCPVCNNPKELPFYSIPYDDKNIISYLKNFYEPQGKIEFNYLKNVDYSLIKCGVCKLIYQEFVPNDELLEILYESWIDPEKAFERNGNLGLEYRLLRFNEIIQVLDYFEKEPNQLSVLDFGMGWGSYCKQLLSLDMNVFGAELSEKRITNAKKYGIQVLNWEEIPKMDLDFINTDDVFEHIVQPNLLLNHLVKGLKKGGVIKISVPNGIVYSKAIKAMNWSAERGAELNLNGVSPLEHINCFFPDSLRELAKSNGLSEISISINRQIKLKDENFLFSMKKMYRKYILGIKSTSLFFLKN